MRTTWLLPAIQATDFVYEAARRPVPGAEPGRSLTIDE
jgi:hypothetical protein